MRVLGLVLAGALVLTAPLGLQAGSLGPGYHPMPNGWNGDSRRVPGPSRQWNGGWVSRRWWPLAGWGLYIWGAPYTGWGGAYVPYRSYGEWGALWYPYAEWREPHGGWGNP